jgi:DNA-binding transcriptional MerR regulator
MPWSTAQIADLAGVTVKAIRHYHSIGVLDEPDRAPNGYKQYGIPHLVRVLQVKRLNDLGVPLARVTDVAREGEQPLAALRVIDAELASTITRLERVRAELTTLLRHGGTTDVPTGFHPVASGLSDADRALLLVSSRVLNHAALADLRSYLGSHPRTAAEDAFDDLAPDAPAAEVARVADLLRSRVDALREDYPWVSAPALHASRDVKTTGGALDDAVAELYNPAQRAVLRLLSTGSGEPNGDASV